MKLLVLPLLLLVYTCAKAQTPCEKRYDKLIEDINNAQTIKALDNLKLRAGDEIKYISENCPIYWAQNQDKLNQARANANERYKRLSQGASGYGQPINTKTSKISQSPQYQKYKNAYVKIAPHCSNEFSHSPCNAYACVCDWCHLNRGNLSGDASYAKRLDAYLNSLPKFTGDEDVDEQGNMASAQSAAGYQMADNTQQQQQTQSVLNEYKNNPIAYNNDSGSKSARLTEKEKIEVASKLKSDVAKIADFDGTDPAAVFGVTESKPKKDTIIPAKFFRGDEAFIDIIKQYMSVDTKPKSKGSMIINIKINEKGQVVSITDISVTCVPADLELEARVQFHIRENYNNSWDPKWHNAVLEGSDLSYKLTYEKYEPLVLSDKAAPKKEIVVNIAEITIVQKDGTKEIKEFFAKLKNDAKQSIVDLKKNYNETIGQKVNEVKVLLDPSKGLGETATTEKETSEIDSDTTPAKEEYTFIDTSKGRVLCRVYRIDNKRARLVPIE